MCRINSISNSDFFQNLFTSAMSNWAFLTVNASLCWDAMIVLFPEACLKKSRLGILHAFHFTCTIFLQEYKFRYFSDTLFYLKNLWIGILPALQICLSIEAKNSKTKVSLQNMENQNGTKVSCRKKNQCTSTSTKRNKSAMILLDLWAFSGPSHRKSVVFLLLVSRYNARAFLSRF